MEITASPRGCRGSADYPGRMPPPEPHSWHFEAHAVTKRRHNTAAALPLSSGNVGGTALGSTSEGKPLIRPFHPCVPGCHALPFRLRQSLTSL